MEVGRTWLRDFGLGYQGRMGLAIEPLLTLASILSRDRHNLWLYSVQMVVVVKWGLAVGDSEKPTRAPASWISWILCIKRRVVAADIGYRISDIDLAWG